MSDDGLSRWVCAAGRIVDFLLLAVGAAAGFIVAAAVVQLTSN